MIPRLRPLLTGLYAPADIEMLATRIETRLATVPARETRAEAWSPADVLLIAYGDAIRGPGEAPLRSLGAFLRERLPGLVSHIHLLPFFPYTSDDGFAVSDYRKVDPVHGDWSDIEALSEDFALVFDLVINHASSAHPRFRDFVHDRPPGNRYFATGEEGEDLSGVTRPRASPLLQRFETTNGPRWVWCTFSRDQVDWDFSNPEVLYEFVDIFLGYIERGASWTRLDAIAYLWKERGTNCVHRPQTHAVVRVLRLLAEAVSGEIKILTETNVPLEENLSYFGDGDEAHIVYNFPLPPLSTHALLTGRSTHLTRWCRGLPALPAGCTYLNFTASHDGIGLRPAEGILSEEELGKLLDCVEAFGGRLTQRRQPDGSLSPYEANISLFDALKGTVAGPDAWQVDRFLVSQGLMMALAGVPAIYYNSLWAAPNHHAGLAETGRNRTLNRRKWTPSELEQHLADATGAPRQVLDGLRQMLVRRREQPAFHPEAAQECLDVDPRLFVLRRGGSDEAQTLLCVFNLSSEPVSVDRSRLDLATGSLLHTQFQRGDVVLGETQVSCSPYAMVWWEQEVLSLPLGRENACDD